MKLIKKYTSHSSPVFIYFPSELVRSFLAFNLRACYFPIIYDLTVSIIFSSIRGLYVTGPATIY